MLALVSLACRAVIAPCLDRNADHAQDVPGAPRDSSRAQVAQLSLRVCTTVGLSRGRCPRNARPCLRDGAHAAPRRRDAPGKGQERAPAKHRVQHHCAAAGPHPPIAGDHYRRREQRNDLQRSEPMRMAPATTAASSPLPPDLDDKRALPHRGPGLNDAGLASRNPHRSRRGRLAGETLRPSGPA